MFDLLTGQCDRHADNMFVSRHGRLALIDHESAMGVVLRCRASSLLLPTTMCVHCVVVGVLQTTPV